ncbi:hypothetical protein BHE74_00051174 [Ensete ventricosum]|nr:hypothetical protein BHE74_00051174 [Ensete ventricosum]
MTIKSGVSFYYPPQSPWCGGGRGAFIPAQTSWSYVGHVITIVLDKPPVIWGTVGWSAAAFVLTHRSSPVVRGQGGTVCRSTAASTLTRRPLPAVRGYYSPVDRNVCPDTLLVARRRGSGGTDRGLVWHVGSATPSAIKGR